ncbi:hypothetical protein FACS1894172_03700 [Spirochaetia bacterium]|nr:hypothetical protein FACS1894172_03700 [Spirochaetia bacterium]
MRNKRSFVGTISLGLILISLVFAGCDYIPGETDGDGDAGIYIGLITFNGTASDRNYGPLFLNSTNRDRLKSQVSSIESNGTTAVYYAVHKAIANITTSANTHKLPANVDSINIITFTDGIDTASVSAQDNGNGVEGQNFSSAAMYGDYVKDQIANRTIKDKHINAYSVGIYNSTESGSSLDGFGTVLQNIANPGNATPLTDFNQLRGQFSTILSNLSISSSTSQFKLTIARPETDRTIRVTFDGNDPDPSNQWFQAVATRDGTSSITRYTLSNIITSSNITYSGASTVTGQLYGNQAATFTFNGLTGITPANAKIFFKNSGVGTWTQDIETGAGGTTETITKNNSAVIYLVLDTSGSLGADINTVKNVVNAFIDSVYEQKYTPGSSGSSNNPQSLVQNVDKQGTLALGATDTYTFSATSSASYTITWEDYYDYNTSQTRPTAGISVTAIGPGNIILFENMCDGFANPQILPSVSGTVTIKVKGYPNDSTGTYWIKYD